jgi:hypothetical protein
MTCVATPTIDTLKITMNSVRHKIQDNSVVQDVVAEGTVMPGLVIPGITIMIIHVTCNQRMQCLTTHADCTMEHILDCDAGKAQILLIFKEDEHPWDELVVSTKGHDIKTITTTVETTTMLLETNINLKIKTNRRIFTKTLNQTHQIKWLCIPQIIIPT